MEWVSYGFLAGMVCGVLLGWFFAGFIGAFVRVALAAIVVVPLILLFLAWRKFVSPLLRPPSQPAQVGPPAVIDTTAVVHGTVREPLPR
jgi:hypothetical protein